ncbi:MAG: hypothetical protein NZZ41_06045 [Candidatus Dojkabacteria bacterium]|nr:hypothetical protein [Candidatus Dojkabacteria bacterium]
MTSEKNLQKNTKKIICNKPVYYSLWDKNTGFLVEYKTEKEALDALYFYWKVYKKNIESGKWKKTRPFTYYIVKRDLNISPLHSEKYEYDCEILFEEKQENYENDK